MHGEGGVAELIGALLALILLAAAVRAVTRRSSFPFSVALVLTGIAAAELVPRGPSWLHPLTELELSSELILLVFLPTLVYASATEMDARQLRHNLAPVLFLAVPGLLLSTGLIGLVLTLVTPLPVAVALLVGAILSATDPVAVISLFQRLGAPQRLTVLVEGESLFNDATAIVVSRILLGIALSGVVDAGTIVDGTADFVKVFAGGLVVGWLLALAVGWLLGLVNDDPFIEVPLTIVLAYASFLVAEEALHVSGVMAVVAAGLTLGGWGRTKVSPAVEPLMESTWEQLAFAANALVFLLVGLRVDLGAIGASWAELAWVVAAMLVARAVVLFGLLPAVDSLPSVETISSDYRLVMWWGGLRGAIALALVLSLPPDLAGDLDLVAVVTGVVLVTLLAQGLTMQGLVKRLGLDEPPVRDQILRAEVEREGLRAAHAELDQLRDQAMFPARVGGRLQRRLDEAQRAAEEELRRLRGEQVDDETQRRLLWLRLFSVESAALHELFADGHIGEATARELQHRFDLQFDWMRHTGRLEDSVAQGQVRQRLQRRLLRWVDRLLARTTVPARIHAMHTAHAYERTWAQYRTASAALQELDHLAEAEELQADQVDAMRTHYDRWRGESQHHLDAMAEEFPEFVAAVQQRLATRMLLHTRRRVIDEHAHHGVLPTGLANALSAELADEALPVRGITAHGLEVDLVGLLRSIPVFAELSVEETQALADRLHQQTVPPGHEIIRQGEPGSSLFLIARGVVRASVRTDDGVDVDTTTMLAGDFFGEVALLHGGRRTATCRAVTPVAVYEVDRSTVRALAQEHPGVQAALDEADRARNEALGGGAAALDTGDG